MPTNQLNYGVNAKEVSLVTLTNRYISNDKGGSFGPDITIEQNVMHIVKNIIHILKTGTYNRSV